MREEMHRAQDERRNAGTYMALARRSGLANGQSHGALDNETRALFGKLIAEGKHPQKTSATPSREIESVGADMPRPNGKLGLLVAFGFGAIAASLLQR
jgi:hypothetical protein